MRNHDLCINCKGWNEPYDFALANGFGVDCGDVVEVVNTESEFLHKEGTITNMQVDGYGKKSVYVRVEAREILVPLADIKSLHRIDERYVKEELSLQCSYCGCKISEAKREEDGEIAW